MICSTVFQKISLLKIRAGSRDAEVLYKGCSIQRPEVLEIVSPGRYLWVKFFSDDNYENLGFFASWIAIDSMC